MSLLSKYILGNVIQDSVHSHLFYFFVNGGILWNL